MAAAAATGLIGEAHADAAQTPNRLGPDGIYDVRHFGAKGDGRTVDTAAVQTAIDACSRGGGGTVLVPAGVFVIGATELKSNVVLHVATGGTLLGSGDGKQYHAIEAIPLSGDTTLVDGNWALLYAVNAKNITIEGPGTIDGQGALFHSKGRGTVPPSGLSGTHRPHHFLAYRCANVSVRNIDLIDCAYHCLRIIQCTRVQFDGVYIHSRVNGNNDGFHFVSSEHVTISNCTVLAQDDACALFGSCKFFTITNSFFSTRWSVFRFGGGHTRDIAVSNCVLFQVYGCPIKFQGNPGSKYENISFANLTLDDVTGPIHLGVGPRFPHNPSTAAATDDMNPDGVDEDPTPAAMRNISFSNIRGNVTTHARRVAGDKISGAVLPAENHSCIVLNCVGGSTMEDVSLSDISLTFGRGGTAEEAARRDLPPYEGEYFMLGPMPAFGIYARGVCGLSLQNVRLQVSAADLRPAVVLDGVIDVSISGLTVQANPSIECALRLINSKQVLIIGPRLVGQAPVYLQIEGSHSERLVVDGGDITSAAAAFRLTGGARPEAITMRP